MDEILERIKTKYRVESTGYLDGDVRHWIHTGLFYPNNVQEYKLCIWENDGSIMLNDWNDIARSLGVFRLRGFMYTSALAFFEDIFNIQYNDSQYGFYVVDITEDNILQKIEAMINVFNTFAGIGNTD